MNIFTRICFTLFLFFVLKSATAQVGINTLSPDPNSVLDIQSKDKGVKLPQIKDTSLLNPPADSSGYLIYDKTGKKFRYWNGRFWETVNPMQVDNKENVTALGNMTVNGTSMYAPNADSVSVRNAIVKANSFEGYGIVPVGGIIMWSGMTNTLSSSWVLCTGDPIVDVQSILNGKITPNLKGRFIVGYDPNNVDYNDYSKGTKIGGNNFDTLKLVNMPVHSHDAGQLVTDPGGRHSHSIGLLKDHRDGSNGNNTIANVGTSYPVASYTSEASDHAHSISGKTQKAGGIYYPEQWHNDNTGSPDAKYTKENCTTYTNCMSTCNSIINAADKASCILGCGYQYDYTNMCDRIDYNPNYGKKVVDSPEISYNQPFDNRPAYYVLAFIMRVK